MIKNRKGFTIVEVTIVVAIIAILAAISIVMYSKVQTDTRNTDRTSKIDVIAGALEKYYGTNGEYPSCSAMTQSGALVSANVLTGIDLSALLVPGAAAGVTNSITCTALTAGSGPDVYAYVGDGSATCTTGAACLKYTLQYRKEGTGEIVAKESIHTAALGLASVPTLSASSASSTSVNLSWTSVANATQYRFERATDTDFLVNRVATTTSNISATASGLTAGTTYYFRVLAIAAGSESNWSNTASVVSVIAPPTSTPTMSAVMNGTNAEGTSSVVACPAGTAQYQLRTRNSNTSTMSAWTAWTAWSTTRVSTVAATQGYQYEFQTHARCLVGAVGSSATVDSNVATTVRTIAAPGAPTYLTPSIFNSPNYAIVNYSGSCPAGTTLSDTTYRTVSWSGQAWGPHPWGFNDQWLNTIGYTRNVNYYGKYKCKTYWTTSSYGPESYNSIPVTSS